MAFGGIKTEELACAGINRLVGRLDPHVSADDEQERSLRHLVVVELLSGVELDQHDAALAVLRVEHGR